MSFVVEKLRVDGTPLSGDFSKQIVTGRLTLSSRSVTAFDFTVLDNPDLHFTSQAGGLFNDGTVIVWEDYAMGLSSFETGGEAKAPVVKISATSFYVRELQDETGGKSWGTADVSAWAREFLTAKGAKSIIQPGLGERPIERLKDEGNGTDPQSSWDVLAEMAKQTGAWLFEYGDTIVLARPSWLLTRPGTREFNIVWNSWTDHTDALTAAPRYSWNKDLKLWQGRESLTIQALDPGPGQFNTMAMARPGDIVNYTGAAAVTEDPVWVVVDVEHPIIPGTPATITAWRAIDPPEIMPESAAGGDSAGVPTGPIGQGGWMGVQLENAAEIVKEGQRRNLPTLAIQLAVACSMGESSLRNKGYGDAAGPDSAGLFQQRDNWGSRSERLSPAKAAGFFYAALTATPYENRYNNGANSLAVSNIGVVFIGPGKSANSASVTIHNVQVNADPYHYAKHWNDAKLVVAACIEAGEDKEDGGTLSGPAGQKIEASMKAMEGKLIEHDGAWLYQCVDVGKRFVSDLTGIRSFSANGNQFWMHPVLMPRFAPIRAGAPKKKGDIVGWAGNYGAYPNGGVGHVAIYSHTKNGADYYLSQNPGAASIRPLQSLGIQGYMRFKG